MDKDELAAVLEVADDLFEKDPNARLLQPPGEYVEKATELLGEDAPWHRVAAVAFALIAEEEHGEHGLEVEGLAKLAGELTGD